MDDNMFDDVDAILASEEGIEEEKNFNESELQDIMSEIEDLEKEFEAEPVAMTLQEKIDAELAMELDSDDPTMVASVEEVDEVIEPEMIITPEIEAEIQAEVEAEMEAEFAIDTTEEIPTAQVLSFEKVAPAAPVALSSTKTPAEVSFAAHGQMTLSLDFKIGQEEAKLSIDPVKGLIVTLSGVELCINEDSGCTVSMENGMKFTIPLSSQENSLKKKSA